MPSDAHNHASITPPQDGHRFPDRLPPRWARRLRRELKQLRTWIGVGRFLVALASLLLRWHG